MTTSDEFEARWQRYTAAIAKANEINKTAVFDALTAAGITQIVVGFDGEGDSGQIDGAAAFKDDEAVDFPDTQVSIIRAQSGSEEFTSHEVPLRGAVEELCYGYLEQAHAGWENNDGGFGEFHFDVAERTVDLEFSERNTSTLTSDHTF